MKHNRIQSTRALPASLGIAVLALALGGCGTADENGNRDMPPPPVTAVELHSENIEVQHEYAARLRGVREVEVRARVDGILERRLYDEGQYVEQGDILFQIETEPHEIALKQAEAELSNARANRNQAEREYRRVSGLYEGNAISERERDTAQSTLELARAQEELSEARVADARLKLDYTRVKAPVPGATGLESVSEGSLIDRGQLLTTIVQQDPVHARFFLPERDAAIQRAAHRARTANDGDHRYEVRLRLPDGELYEKTGVVDFIGSTIDPRTGTVSFRAVFDNPDGTLTPGQFVRAQVTLENLKGVFAIDPTAIGEGPDGPRVFILLDGDTVESRDVRLGPVVEGKQVVLEGLMAGEFLVTNGHVALEDGMTVSAGIQDKEDR